MSKYFIPLDAEIAPTADDDIAQWHAGGLPQAEASLTAYRHVLTIKNDMAHYLLHVLRMKAGDTTFFCDGSAMDYPAILLPTDKEAHQPHKRTPPKHTDIICRFALGEPVPCHTEPLTRVTLFQGMPKGDKMDSIVQKCVELGVHRIIPVITSRTVAKPKDHMDSEKKTLRYQRIAEAAATQSMRGTIPDMGRPVTFAHAMDMMIRRNAHHPPMHIIAYEGETRRTIADLPRTRPKAAHIWIGPEGGFEAEEVAQLTAQGATAVSLGKRILRTETAGMAMLAMLSCLWGEL